MSVRVLAQRLVRAVRRDRECNFCGGAILRGETAIRTTLLSEGSFGCCYSCLACAAPDGPYRCIGCGRGYEAAPSHSQCASCGENVLAREDAEYYETLKQAGTY